MRSKFFEPFEPKSKCCKAGVKFYKSKNVGYPVCEKCGRQCDHTQPKTKAEKFDVFMKRERDILNYYENNKRRSQENFERMKLLDNVRKEWEKIYFT